MGFPKISLGALGQKPAVTADIDAPADIEAVRSDNKDVITNAPGDAASTASAEKPRPDEDIQRGVKDVQAVTLTWSKRSLVAVFVLYVFPYLSAQSDRPRILRTFH